MSAKWPPIPQIARVRFVQVDAAVGAPILHRYMTDRFPQLRGVKVTHPWIGNVAFTLDTLPHMGQRVDLHYCLGCNDSGVAMMTYLGFQTARKIARVANYACSFDTEDFPTTRSMRAIRGSSRSSAAIIACATVSVACSHDASCCMLPAEPRRRNEMDFETYKGSLAQEAPPDGLSPAAQALWWEAKGDWHQAHQCAQKQADTEGAWAHAYLHRVEGDLSNAGGWYRRAGRPASTAPLKEEWETIARALLG